MTTKGKVWLIGTPVVLVGALVYLLFERATLYQCTACFAENPSRCATHKDVDAYATDEAAVRRFARYDVCWDNDAHVREACEDLPPEHFNITCSSWRQWVRKHYANHYLVH